MHGCTDQSRQAKELASLLLFYDFNNVAFVYFRTINHDMFCVPNLLQVGTVTLLVLTGLFIFMLFFLAATINAIVISLLMSLAAAGGFLALFFAFMTAIYIGALSVAVFIISTVTISAIIAVVITTGRLVGFSVCFQIFSCFGYLSLMFIEVY